MASPPFVSASTTPYCPTHWHNGICVGGSFTQCSTPGISCGWVKDPNDQFWQSAASRSVALSTDDLCPTHYVNGICVGGSFTNCAAPGLSCGWVKDGGDAYWQRVVEGDGVERAGCATQFVDVGGGSVEKCGGPGSLWKRG